MQKDDKPTQVPPIFKSEAAMLAYDEAYVRQECDKVVVKELRKIRKAYDEMERLQNKDGILVYGCDDMWRNWKGIRNVITDRIEEITGSRA